MQSVYDSFTRTHKILGKLLSMIDNSFLSILITFNSFKTLKQTYVISIYVTLFFKSLFFFFCQLHLKIESKRPYFDTFLFSLTYAYRRESIYFSWNFWNSDFDELTCLKIPWIRKYICNDWSVCVYVSVIGITKKQIISVTWNLYHM